MARSQSQIQEKCNYTRTGILTGSVQDEGFPPVSTLDEQAYQRVRKTLGRRAFTPGDRLSIRRVAVALGVSPMPVRTALRRLAAEQAIDLTRSGSAVVPRLTCSAFIELGAIGAELEPLALRIVASKLTAQALDHLEIRLNEHD